MRPCRPPSALIWLWLSTTLAGIVVGRAAVPSNYHPCGGELLNPFLDPPPPQSPDFREKPQPAVNYGQLPQVNGFGAAGAAMRQPIGSLTGKIVFTNGGHGWTADSGFASGWRLQRGLTFGINEDYGNGDQFNLFADYCFNAGAIVVPLCTI